MQHDARLRSIVATSARRGRVVAIVLAVIGGLFVALGVPELLARRDERRAYEAEVDDLRRNGPGERDSRCFQREDGATPCRDTANQEPHCQRQRACATEELLGRAESRYRFAGHSTTKGLMFLVLGVLALGYAAISRFRAARNHARAYELLSQPRRIASITCRTSRTAMGDRSVVVGGEMLDITATDGTRCTFNATHDQLADLHEMLAPHGVFIDRGARGAADRGRPVI